MYDENNKQEFNSANPEEHRTEEPITTNFTMRDPEPETEKQKQARQEPYGGYRDQPYYEAGQNGGYQGGGAPENHPANGMPNAARQDMGMRPPHYQEIHYQRAGSGGYIPPEPPQKPRKKHGMARKAAGVTAAALLFGVVAGSTMVGINWVADGYKSTAAAQVGQGETVGAAVTTAPEEENNKTGGTTAAVSNAVSMDVSEIVEKAMPSVVAITNTIVYQSQSWFGPTQTYEVPASGSGIIVGQNDDELLMVTNNHVVADSKELKVTFIDNTSIDAAIKGTDSDTDLAIIAVPLKDIPADTLSQITIATMGDSDSLKVGQGVIAIGNALGYGQSVTVGYVSALDREVKTEDNTTRDLLQTDAAINPGNSGGALLNMKGELIGINSAKYSSTEVEGMGYAIPISKVQDIIGELMNKKTRVQVAEANQGYLGIQGKNVDETAAVEFGMPKGIYIYKIVEGGAASKSDLREKDIITKFDGQTVRSMEDLKNMLTYYEGGTTVTLTVQSLQNGQYEERNVEITLDYRPREQEN